MSCSIGCSAVVRLLCESLEKHPGLDSLVNEHLYIKISERATEKKEDPVERKEIKWMNGKQ